MEELEKTLITILQKALVVAEQTGEFVIEQAPILLQEFYSWHIAKNVLSLLLFPTIYFISYKVFKYFGEKEKDNYKTNKIFNRYYDWEDVWPVFGIAAIIILGFVAVVKIFISIYNIVFIYVAPKIYLIEYFMHPSGGCG